MCAPAVSSIAGNALTSVGQAILLAKTIGASALIGTLILSIVRIFKYRFGVYKG